MTVDKSDGFYTGVATGLFLAMALYLFLDWKIDSISTRLDALSVKVEHNANVYDAHSRLLRSK